MIIDREIRPLKIINEAREAKPVLVLAYVEIAFVLAQRALSAIDKSMWMLMISLCSLNESLTTSIAYQDIADFVGMSPLVVKQSITRLAAMGFLKSLKSTEGELTCSATYPLEGLLSIKKSEKTMDASTLSALFQGVPNNRPLSIDLLMGYPVGRISCKQWDLNNLQD